MTSSIHYQPWTLQSPTSYAEPWLTEAFARDIVFTSSDAVSSFYASTGSGLSGSDSEMAPTASLKHGGVTKMSGGAAVNKITKRKPRQTKKCQTTYIMADPSNFRQMVQQVTGVRLETLQQQNTQNQLIVKPEPKRLTGNGVGLPTFDTSSIFVDYSVNSQLEKGGDRVGRGQRDGALTDCGEEVGQVAIVDSLNGGSGYGYESYESFPTLESWKVQR